MSEAVLKPIGLTLPQFGALLALRSHQGISQKALAAVLETDTTTMMVVCDALEKKGYLKRLPVPSDRRVNRLEITERGLATLEQAFPLIYAVFEPLMATFTEEESRVVLPILERVFQVVCKLEAEQRTPKRDPS